MTRQCPSEKTLKAFLQGHLDESAIDRTADHLDGCPACSQRVAKLDADASQFEVELRNVTSNFNEPKVPNEIINRAIELNSQFSNPAKSSTTNGNRREFFPEVEGYKIEKRIGRGGMGVVFRATEVKLKRTVALKLIRLAELASRQDLERFEHEARIAARLNHPCIAQIYEVGEANGLPFLSMELVEGGNLTETFQRQPQPAITAAGLMEQVADAIHYAHSQGVIHRDLKPANILIPGSHFSRNAASSYDTPSPSNSSLNLLTPATSQRYTGPPPKIVDFGLAKDLLLAQDLTLTGEMIGTPNYIAPELAKADMEHVGPRTDVYSIGAILFFLLTGRPPFQADSTHRVIRMVCEADPISPRVLQPTVPVDLETICLKCLEKEPARRYESADRLAADLRRFRNHETILAKPTNWAGRMRKWSRRNPIVSILMITIVLLGISGIAGIAYQLNKAIAARKLAEQRAVSEQSATIEAEAAKLLAQSALENSESRFYFASIANANQQYELGKFAEARRTLDALIPTTEQDIDRRGWEWHYLDRQLKTDLLKFQATSKPKQAVYDLAFHPRNRLIAIGTGIPNFLETELDSPGTLSLWDSQTQKFVHRFHAEPPLMGVHQVAFNNDGSRMVSNDYNGRGWIHRFGSIRIWNTETYDSIFDLPMPTAAEPDPEWKNCILNFDMAPDGNHVARVYFLDNRRHAEVWQVDSKKKIWQSFDVTQVVFSADSQSIFVQHANSNRHAVRLHDLSKTELPPSRTPAKIQGNLRSQNAYYSREGNFLGQIGNHWAIRSPSGDILGTLQHEAINSAKFSHDSQWLSVGYPDGSAAILDGKNAHVLQTFRGHEQRVSAVSLSRSRHLLATGDWNGTVRIWNAEQNGRFRESSATSITSVRAVVDIGWAGSDSVLQVNQGVFGLGRWNLETDRLDRFYNNDLLISKHEHAEAIAPNGKLLVTRGENSRELIVTNTQTAERIGRLNSHQLPIQFVTISQNSQRMLSVAWPEDGDPAAPEVFVWDLDSLQIINRFEFDQQFSGSPAHQFHATLNHAGTLCAIWMSPLHDSELSSAQWFGLLEVATGQIVSNLPDHGNPSSSQDSILSLEFSSDDELALSRAGGLIQIIRDAQIRLSINGPDRIMDLAFSPDERRLAGASKSFVHLWDTETGIDAITLELIRSNYDLWHNPKVAFSRDGQKLAASSFLTTRVYDATPESKSPEWATNAKSNQDAFRKYLLSSTGDIDEQLKRLAENQKFIQDDVKVQTKKIELLEHLGRTKQADAVRDGLAKKHKAIVFTNRDFVTAESVPFAEFSAFTIETWTKDFDSTILLQHFTPSGFITTGFTSGIASGNIGWYFDKRHFGFEQATVYSMPKNQGSGWTHLAMVLRQGQQLVFVNGELQNCQSASPIDERMEGPLQIGGCGMVKPRQGSGLMRALRISNVARYHQSFEPAEFWQPDENTELLIDGRSTSFDNLQDLSPRKRKLEYHLIDR